MCTYRTRRAACPQGPTYFTYWVRVPASAVPYAPRTLATQVSGLSCAVRTLLSLYCMPVLGDALQFVIVDQLQKFKAREHDPRLLDTLS